MKNQDKPAYPLPSGAGNDYRMGLTKREIAAIAAMQGFCSTGNYSNGFDAAHDAVKAADALLVELEETK